MHDPNQEPSTGPAHTHIIPPRMPDPPFVSTDPPSSIEKASEQILRRTMISPSQIVAHAQAGRIKELERELDAERMASLRSQERIDVLTEETYLLAQRLTDSQQTVKVLLASQGAGEFAHIAADETGVYVVDVKTQRRHTLVRFDVETACPNDQDCDNMPHELPAAYLALCRYPYLQDESCKLPGGHIGEHGTVHVCDPACEESPDGCVLPVPANPAAYYKALYWEIHGSSCPATCRGHSGG